MGPTKKLCEHVIYAQACTLLMLPTNIQINKPYRIYNLFFAEIKVALDNSSGYQEDLFFMNFQQLRSVREAVRCGFNLTEVANTLHTSQPGVSRQIRELEEELGIELFVRAGKRLTGLTDPGRHVLPIIEHILLGSSNLRQAGAEFASQQSGLLSIAATHSQARYALPTAVQAFRVQFPDIKLHLHQLLALRDGQRREGSVVRTLRFSIEIVELRGPTRRRCGTRRFQL